MITDHPDKAEQMYHFSRSPEYRSPFGAVSTGTYVDLSLDVFFPCEEVKLCYSYGLYSFSYSELLMYPLAEHPDRYHTNIRMPGEPSLFFYWFRVKRAAPLQDNTTGHRFSDHFGAVAPAAKTTAAVLFYVLSRHKADGTGRVSEVPSRIGAHEDRYPAAFQITVFHKDFQTPDWFKGTLLYQIFPDRFSRGEAYVPNQMQAAKLADERIYHDDWYEDVDIHGKPQTGYLACDFFGGTLEGIAEKIPYLKSLHIDCLYLNPIFEARSNHRYDTADYMSADPMLGGNASFSRFSEQMQKNDIPFLLDGVFSHTGADSRYFNKLARYEERGAYQTAEGKGSSEFSSWYSFSRDDTGHLSYDSWWGFADLPNVNENDLSYREYILGKQGVIESWLTRGTGGFRLDVSDELPDSFLRELRSVVKEHTDNKGIILGEVWEDASNKISYGSYRDFLLGNTHDSVMGYTFRDVLLGFLMGAFPAQYFNGRLESYRENYPPQAYYCIMNLISSHDVPRAITVFSGAPDPGDREKQLALFLNESQMIKGLALMRLALVIQMGYVGSPCIYYGDEIGIQGYRDPFNRRTYPWDRLTQMQKEQLAFYQDITGLRRKYPVLRTGAYKTLWAQEDVYIFERYLDDKAKDFFGKPCEGVHRVIFAINRSEKNVFSFTIDKHIKYFAISLDHDIIVENSNMEKVLTDNIPFQTVLKPLSYQIFVYS